MTNNNQQPPQENPNNQFSNSEPMTFAQKIDYVKNIDMTNNKQQTAVDIAELAMKLYPFSNSERNAFITGYNKAREMYEDKMEAEIMKQCATLSTIKASAYEDGFNDGYMKASRTTGTTESGIATGNNISTTGTTTNITHFCEVFEPAYKPSPKVATITCVPCKKCGKSLWQHAKWTNII